MPPNPPQDKPEFVDNLDGNTLASALNAHLDWLGRTYAAPVSMAIASGYFNPEGFALIAPRLRKLKHVRLLLGAEPQPPPARPMRQPGEPRGGRYEARLLKDALDQNEAGLRRDRDLLPFTKESDSAIKGLLDFLGSGIIEVRRYEKAFLHGKAFVFDGTEGVISGSSNFTAAGLTSNLELNLGRYDPAPVRQVRAWFDRLWEEAVPFDLAAFYKERFVDYEPYLVFLRVLWEMYGHELDEEVAETGLRLTGFQKDGLWRARKILERWKGVLIADGVGLGKSFLAGELMRATVQEERRPVLLIAPAALRDGMWRRTLLRWQVALECISFEELVQGNKLQRKPNEYAMIVVDESHGFRNPQSLRAGALRDLLGGTPPKELVLLTATPVNNSLWDLYNLLTLFIPHDGAMADAGIPKLKERFSQAAAQDPDDLHPDALFDVLDKVTVRRTRHFVKKHYPLDRVVAPDGTEEIIRFPDPHVSEVKYELNGAMPGFFEEIQEALAPEDEHQPPKLTMARYFPSNYLKTGKAEEAQLALVGLVRSGLLKRFESSVRAIGLTAQRMADAHEVFLDGLKHGWVLTSLGATDWENVDSDEAFENLLETADKEPVARYDAKKLKKDVENDAAVLRAIANRALGVKAEQDPKLEALVDSLRAVLKKAKDDGATESDIARNRKLIVFSYFGDTVDWINDRLEKVLATDRTLADFRGRLVKVVGDEHRQTAVYGFAPESTQAPPGYQQDKYDILVTTDVLAEGVNLQQCRNIVNYDLPWNPMRLVQRHGRIDRIGSKHKDVFVRCFFPDRRIDSLLRLEERIRRKIAQAAKSIGIESEVIPRSEVTDIVFAETRAEIERIRSGDATLLETAGEDPSAHSGEEYRQELRKALETRRGAILGLPWGAGSGLARGDRSGHFFCARVGDRVFLRFVPKDGTTVERETLQCLKRVTCDPGTPCVLSDAMRTSARDAWVKARQDIYAQWAWATDPANLQPRVKPIFKEAANRLRLHPPPRVEQEDLRRIIESLEAPWGPREERELRRVFDPGTPGDPESSSHIVAKVKQLGLRPYQAPKPLDPIDLEEVRLVAWMAVTASVGAEPK